MKRKLVVLTLLLSALTLLTEQSFGQGAGTNPGLTMYRYNSSSTGSPLPVLNGDLLGTLKWNGLANYGDIRTGAAIQSFITDPVAPGVLQANMIFRTSDLGGLTNRMIITEEGLVGIGLDNPAFNLHVVGNTHTTGDFYGRIHFDANVGTNDAPDTYIDEAYFELKNRAVLTGGSALPATAGVQGGVLSLAPGGSSLDHQLYFGSDGIWTRRTTGNAANWGGANWFKMLTGEQISGTPNRVARFLPPGPVSNALGDSQLFDDGTDVGIGTNTPDPAFLLTVAGDTRVNGSIRGTANFDLAGNSTVGGNATVIGNENVNGNSIVGGDAEVDGNLGVGIAASSFRLDVNGESNFRQRVKIGANNFATDYLLSVGGGVMAEEVRVQLQPWADYVFEKNYPLMPLSEVEKFVEKEKHLPGIATANEVETNGLNLGEMQNAQMEKIEEIFLHLIDLEKRVNALEAQNKQLLEENAALKAKSDNGSEKR